MYYLIVLFFLTLSYLLSSAEAGVINASSGSREHIQAALNSATVGDTILVPEGDFVFNGGITVNAGITILGAGRDKTVLRRTSSGSAWLFTVNGSNGEPFVFSGFTVIGLAPSNSFGIKLINHCKDFRIHGNTFRRLTNRAIEIHGNSRGVIYDNRFIDNFTTAIVVFGDGDAAWNRPLTLGSEHAVYIEDNYFEQRNIPDPTRVMHVASNNGSRYVFRHNVINDGNINSQAADAHGRFFYWPRGSRSYEIYNNHFTFGHRWLGINIRGGDGVIFGNKFNGSMVNAILLQYEGRNESGNTRYPYIDQIRQLHIWENVRNGGPADVYVRHPATIREGRDFFRYKNEDYTPYTYPHPLTMEPMTEDPDTGDTTEAEYPDDNTSISGIRRISRGIDGISVRSVAGGSGGVAKINYTLNDDHLQNSSQVKFTIYNMRGQRIHSITRSHHAGGTFSLEMDRALASGVYNVVMVVGNYSVSGRLMIGH